MWEELRVLSQYDARVAEIRDFNKSNRYIKRGIAMIPTMFGIAFHGKAKFLNQVYSKNFLTLSFYLSFDFSPSIAALFLELSIKPMLVFS